MAAQEFNVTIVPLFGDSPDNNKPYNLPPVPDDPFADYDYSQMSYPLPLKTIATWEIGIKIACYVVIIFIALFGNLLVVTTVFSNLRMRTTTNFYIVNLALSDLMVTLSCTWVHLVDDLTEGWVLGAFFCKFNSFAQVLSLVASILTLTLISCDRFFGIVFALKARLTQRRWKTFILLVWIIAISISAPLLVFRRQESRTWQDHTEIWCQDAWPEVPQVDPSTGTRSPRFPGRTTYYTAISLVIYFIPIVIMSAAYSVIIWKLWSTQPPGEMIDRENATQMAIKKKVILMLLVILSVFAVCWFPFQVSILYNEYRPDRHGVLPAWYSKFQYFATFLAYSNSAFNPIIYTCFNNSFRRGFRETFRRSFRRRRSRATTFSTYYNTMEVKMDTMVKDSRQNLMTISDKQRGSISNGVRL